MDAPSMWGYRHPCVETVGNESVRVSTSITSGPQRTVENVPDPDFKPRHVGFTARLEDEGEDQ